MSSMMSLPAGSLFASCVRMYVAPVDRAVGAPAAFDLSTMGRFAVDAPPGGWLSVGAVADFKRSTGEGLREVLSGAPAVVKSQARAVVAETISFTMPAWTRLALALSSGQGTLNLLKTVNGAAANPSGGTAAMAELLAAGSTSTVLVMAAATSLEAGDVVAVDADYAGTTGYVGSYAAGAYLASVPSGGDADLLRRVSFNVSVVLSVNGTAVTLASPLPAGAPPAGFRVAVVEGFADRNGGSFVQEWSALFVVDGFEGDRLLLHYPRLQPAGGSAAEVAAELAAGVVRWRPTATMRALPVVDAVDGVVAVSFRSYLPAPMRRV